MGIGRFRNICISKWIFLRIDMSATPNVDKNEMNVLLLHGRGDSAMLSYVFDRQISQAEKFSDSRRDELAIDPCVAGIL